MTPAVDRLRREGVPFKVHRLDIPHRGGELGLLVARRMAVPACRVLKTLVTRLSDGRLAAAVVPAVARLDPKALAAALGARSADLSTPAEAERASGSVVGAISPLGLRRDLPTAVDTTALEHETVFVSAGRRGLELELGPEALVRLTGATVAPLAAPGGTDPSLQGPGS